MAAREPVLDDSRAPAFVREERRRAAASFAFARRHPRLASARVRLLIGCATAWLALWTLGLAVAPIAFLLWAGRLPILLLVIAWLGVIAIGSCLVVRLPKPDGYAITAASAPELAARIEAARRAVGAPQPDRVHLIFTGCDVRVSQRLGLGLLGPRVRTTLIIGAPTVFASSDEELVALLVYAFAAIEGQHGRSQRRIVRALRRGPRVAENLDRAPGVEWLVGVPFETLLERLALHGTALCRAEQLAADRRAARICRPTAFASAVARMTLVERQADAYVWAPLLAAHDAPPTGTLEAICEHASVDLDAPDRAISELLEPSKLLGGVRVTNAWTLPYRDRVEALDVTERQLRFELASRGPRDPLLLDEARGWLPLVEERWLAAVRPGWQAARARIQQRLGRLQFLDRLEATGRLSGSLVGERDRLAGDLRAAQGDVGAREDSRADANAGEDTAMLGRSRAGGHPARQPDSAWRGCGN